MSEAVETELPPDGEPQHLHIAGLFVGFIAGLPQLIFPMLAALFGARAGNNPILIPIIVGAAFGFSLFFRWLAWRRFTYTLGEHDIRIERGLISRTVRSIPYERIQDVSVEQQFLARLMGLAEVKFESGGGEGEDAKLSYVSVAQAEALRESIRERKNGEVRVADVEEVAAEKPPIFAMDTKRLITFGLYSFSLVIFAVLAGAAQQIDFLLPFDFWDFGAWIGVAEDRGVNIDTITHIGMAARIVGATVALAALLVVGLASGILRVCLRDYGFRLDRTDRGLRRRRGLLTRTDVVMPVHRVQGAIIQTGPIRKRRGWHALKFVSLAQDSKKEPDYLAVPFAQMDEIWPVVSEAGLKPPADDLPFRRGAGRAWMIWILPVVLALIGWTISATLALELRLGVIARAYWLLIPAALLIWLNWRRYADAEDGAQLYVRRGWWRERLNIVDQVKVQTVEIAQGPLSRRLGLATIHFGIAGGNLHMVAVPLAKARAIRDAVMKNVAAVDFSEINRASAS